MGLTERHWFENEDVPENYEWALEDAVYNSRTNKKADIVEVVRCKDCKHRPKEPNWTTFENGFDIEFPEGSKCPCQCSGDQYYSWYPEDNWFCANGKRRDDDA